MAEPETILENVGIVLIEANGTTDLTTLIELHLVNPEIRRRFPPLFSCKSPWWM